VPSNLPNYNGVFIEGRRILLEAQPRQPLGNIHGVFLPAASLSDGVTKERVYQPVRQTLSR
jgi:hypothetical protein